ncbi:MAG: tyrosine--tRNA ligase [Acidimicrobiales bacterium]
MTSFSADLRWRGLLHQVTDDALLALLDGGRVTVYTGFDPTAASLHLGHLLPLLTLRRFQLAGHRPIALAGGGTGMVGDPGGRSGERALLGPAALAANLEGVRPQLARFLDFDDALLLDNAAWLGEARLLEFLRDVGKHFTVNQMVAKESVRSRSEQGISYTEFSYMLLQAYDFLRLHVDHGCDVQVGGSDQWGNITMGVDLVRRVAGDHVHGLTTPLLTKADGTKYGKSEAGAVWLDPDLTSPYQLYQFLLQAEDDVVGAYLRQLTFLDRPEIEALEAETVARPERRAAQRALAHEVCALVHGDEEAARAERASRALFDEEIAALDERSLLDVFAEAPSTKLARAALDGGGLAIVDALVRAGLESSRGGARRVVGQGGAYVNNRRVEREDRALSTADLLHDRYVVLRRGRRDQHLLRFE